MNIVLPFICLENNIQNNWAYHFWGTICSRTSLFCPLKPGLDSNDSNDILVLFRVRQLLNFNYSCPPTTDTDKTGIDNKDGAPSSQLPLKYQIRVYKNRLEESVSQNFCLGVRE